MRARSTSRRPNAFFLRRAPHLLLLWLVLRLLYLLYLLTSSSSPSPSSSFCPSTAAAASPSDPRVQALDLLGEVGDGQLDHRRRVIQIVVGRVFLQKTARNGLDLRRRPVVWFRCGRHDHRHAICDSGGKRPDRAHSTAQHWRRCSSSALTGVDRPESLFAKASADIASNLPWYPSRYAVRGRSTAASCIIRAGRNELTSVRC